MHFRGTDKSSEAPRARWDDVAVAVRQRLAARPDLEVVFVASDEAEFPNFLARECTSRPVVARDDAFRSTDGQPVHVVSPGREAFAKGEDALMNCLILSRCESVIRTSSFLSAWASVFNPDLEVVRLNRPYDDTFWFPERAITSVAPDAP